MSDQDRWNEHRRQGRPAPRTGFEQADDYHGEYSAGGSPGEGRRDHHEGEYRGRGHDDRGFEAQARRAGEETRSWWDKTTDKVSSFLGDEDHGRHDGGHRGRGPKGYRRSDERIREDVADRLTEDHYLDASDIEILVENGEVTLSGTIRRRDDKRRAEHLAESVSGVTHVQNNLRVGPDQTQGGNDLAGVGI